jgi:hypothetical protein
MPAPRGITPALSVRPERKQVKSMGYRQGFFFEKKKQKTFNSSLGLRDAGSVSVYPRAQDIKVFWFFSSEKTMLAV